MFAGPTPSFVLQRPHPAIYVRLATHCKRTLVGGEKIDRLGDFAEDAETRAGTGPCMKRVRFAVKPTAVLV